MAIDLSLGPFVLDRAPQDGVLSGSAGHGAFLVDRSTGALYRNTGTISATVWAKIADVRASDSPQIGDVPTWDGSKYVSQAPTRISFNGQTVNPADGTVQELALTVGGEWENFHDGGWSNAENGDLALPTPGWYRCRFLYGVEAPTGDVSEPVFNLNSATSDNSAGAIGATVPAPGGSGVVETYIHTVAANETVGVLQVQQVNAAAYGLAITVAVELELLHATG